MDYEEFRQSIDLYLDGELDSPSILKFRELADSDPRCRELLEREENFRLQVREGLTDERAPQGLRARILRNIRREDLRQSVAQTSVWRVAAAVLLAVLIGGGATYYTYERRDLLRLVDYSIKTHRLYASSANPAEFQAKTERALLPWAQKRVPFKVAFPSLAQSGVEMLGGRVSLLADRESALTFYKTGDKRLSLFTIDNRDIRLPRWGGKKIGNWTVYFQDKGNFRVAVWKGGQCVYTLVAQLQEDELTKYLSTGFQEIVGPRDS